MTAPTHVVFSETSRCFVHPGTQRRYTGVHSFMDRQIKPLDLSYTHAAGVTARAIAKKKRMGGMLFKGDAKKGGAVQHGLAVHEDLQRHITTGAALKTNDAKRVVAALREHKLTPVDSEVPIASLVAGVATSIDIACTRRNAKGESEYVAVELKTGMDRNKQRTGFVGVRKADQKTRLWLPWTPFNRALMQAALTATIANSCDLNRYAISGAYMVNVRTLDVRVVNVGAFGWAKGVTLDAEDKRTPIWRLRPKGVVAEKKAAAAARVPTKKKQSSASKKTWNKFARRC